MSDKKIIAPLRQLTNLEYLCVTGVAKIKDLQGGLKGDGSQDAVRLPLMINSLEHKISLALGEKFGLSQAEIRQSNFDLTLKSGHFVELIDKNEQSNNSSGE